MNSLNGQIKAPTVDRFIPVFAPKGSFFVQKEVSMLKWCEGYPGYSVDENGVVYSHKRKVSRGIGRGTKVIIEDLPLRALKVSPGRAGYPAVNISSGKGHGTVVYVHRLVAKAFIPNPLNKPQVHHKDFNITNFLPSNLEWLNGSENNKRSVASLRMGGEKNNLHKLSIKDVIAIRALAETSIRRKDIAAMFKITPDYVTNIYKRETWKQIP